MHAVDANRVAGMKDPGEFSLVLGGPLYQLMRKARLEDDAAGLVRRRVVVMVLLAWLPLLLLSMAEGHAWGESRSLSFLADIEMHARLLLALPLLVVAEIVVHQRMRPVVRQFVDRGLVGGATLPGFEAAIASAMRLRNSVSAEVGLLLFAIFGGYTLGQHYLTLSVSTWYAAPVDGDFSITAAGYWYLFVSLTAFRFLLFRWYFRLLVWYRFLWQVARRVPLRLNALHPDGAAGLGFLSGSAFALQPLLLAQTVALSGILAGKILQEGATLPQFKLEIAAWMLFLIVLALAPLTFFVVRLADAKRAAMREYGLLGSRYVAEFRRKWIAGKAAPNENLLGAADIQSLADLSASFDVVRNTSLVPFGRSTIVRLVIVAALPLAPLALTMVPLDQLIDRALAVFF